MSIFSSFVQALWGAVFGAPVKTRAEIEAMLAKRAEHAGEPLNWQHSIIDLMKLLKIDSSVGARIDLADELGYSGNLDGGSAMNVWLYERVMAKLAKGEYS